MTPKEFEKHLAGMYKKIDAFFEKDAPMVAANVAASLFKENFQKEGFFGGKWSEVDRRTGGHINQRGRYVKNYAKGADRSRKILTGKTGDLGRSIKKEVARGNATVYSDTKYGAYHNDGAKNLPQRQFIGEHPALDKAIMDSMIQKINQLVN